MGTNFCQLSTDSCTLTLGELIVISRLILSQDETTPDRSSVVLGTGYRESAGRGGESIYHCTATRTCCALVLMATTASVPAECKFRGLISGGCGERLCCGHDRCGDTCGQRIRLHQRQF